MKAATALLALLSLFSSMASAAEPAKPQVKMTVHRQVLDSDHDLHRRQGSSAKKTIALKVEITNSSSATLAAARLAGEVLVLRADTGKKRERLVKEGIAAVDVPELKPNARTTLVIGKIQLSEVEWGDRKREETLEAWKVTCSQGATVVGTVVSDDDYDEQAKTAVAAAKEPAPVKKKKRAIRRVPR